MGELITVSAATLAVFNLLIAFATLVNIARGAAVPVPAGAPSHARR